MTASDDEDRTTSEARTSPVENSSPDSAAHRERQHLELAKLRAEVANLTRSPILTPAVLIPAIAALTTLVITASLGVFDTKKAALENQKTLIEIEISRLQQQKQTTQTDVTQIQAQLKQAETEKAAVLSQLDQLKATLEQARKSADAEVSSMKRTFASPLLQFEEQADATTKLALDVKNAGHGSALVRMQRMFVDGRLVTPGQSPNQGLPLLTALGINDSSHGWNWFLSDNAFKEGQSLRLVYRDTPTSSLEQRNFADTVARLGVEICYCTLLGNDCKWAMYQRPRPAETCK